MWSSCHLILKLESKDLSINLLGSKSSRFGGFGTSVLMNFVGGFLMMSVGAMVDKYEHIMRCRFRSG